MFRSLVVYCCQTFAPPPRPLDNSAEIAFLTHRVVQERLHKKHKAKLEEAPVVKGATRESLFSRQITFVRWPLYVETAAAGSRGGGGKGWDSKGALQS